MQALRPLPSLTQVNDLAPTMNTIQEHKIYADGPVLYLGKDITDFCTVQNMILFHGLNK
jgi:hypothetical protein